jgi:periplasmic divalent cation tolerance protein
MQISILTFIVFCLDNGEHYKQLLIKCKTQDFAKIQHCIQENHSYEVPEIIQIPISNGLPEYFQWIENVT